MDRVSMGQWVVEEAEAEGSSGSGSLAPDSQGFMDYSKGVQDSMLGGTSPLPSPGLTLATWRSASPSKGQITYIKTVGKDMVAPPNVM